MSSITTKFLFTLLFLLFSLKSSSSHASSIQHHQHQVQQDEKLSAYDVLQQYGFPVGLLPKGIIGYALNKETGEFAAYMDATCSFSIEGYTLKYKSTITGVITQGRLYNLKGVSVKILLLWLNIVEVKRDGDEIQFSVGIASANFGVENFYESPQCGCGFDCVTVNTLPLSSI
ncbi:uncharacterized protein LOC130961510 [Arachis stenosperma]|uniref:uncharacterized protein LOC130961510 n=1 Tax=Arachis stenosperma TaxID=217475 RepID=UPI0025AD5AB7|nr:uncharacterized protein LOC130961510 [Arachis stenosperma]